MHFSTTKLITAIFIFNLLRQYAHTAHISQDEPCLMENMLDKLLTAAEHTVESTKNKGQINRIVKASTTMLQLMLKQPHLLKQ